MSNPGPVSVIRRSSDAIFVSPVLVLASASVDSSSTAAHKRDSHECSCLGRPFQVVLSGLTGQGPGREFLSGGAVVVVVVVVVFFFLATELRVSPFFQVLLVFQIVIATEQVAW